MSGSPKCSPMLTECPRCKNVIGKSDTPMMAAFERIIGGHPVEDCACSDNIAIALCTYFDDHHDCPDEDLGELNWKPWVIERCNAVIKTLAVELAKHAERELAAVTAERDALKGHAEQVAYVSEEYLNGHRTDAYRADFPAIDAARGAK